MTRRTLVRILGTAVSVLCLGYFFVHASTIWRSSGVHFPRGGVGAFAIAMVPYLAAALLLGGLWNMLLRGLGFSLSLPRAWAIYFTAQFGKYLPGNVGHLAGRVVLSARYGAPAALVATSLLLETLITVFAAGLLSLPLVGRVLSLLRATWRRVPTEGLIAAILAMLVLTAVAVWAVRRSALARRVWSRFAPSLRLLWRRQFGKWVLAAIVAALIAFSLSSLPLMLVTGLPTMQIFPRIPFVVGLFSLAWIAGSIVPGAPAGLGVRDTILAEGLTPLLGAGPAVTATLLFRLLTTLSDLVMFAIGALLLRCLPSPTRTLGSDEERAACKDGLELEETP